MHGSPATRRTGEVAGALIHGRSPHLPSCQHAWRGAIRRSVRKRCLSLASDDTALLARGKLAEGPSLLAVILGGAGSVLRLRCNMFDWSSSPPTSPLSSSPLLAIR